MRLAWIAALIAALLALAPIATAETTTTWHLFGQDHASFAERVMQQDSATGSTEDTVEIAAGDCQLWIADQDAEVDVTFDKDSWTGDLLASEGTVVLDDPSAYSANIGVVATDGSFTTEIADTPVEFEENGGTRDYGSFLTDTSGTFTVPDTGTDGDYLGFELCNHTSQKMTLFTDGSGTQIESPSDQPDYPTLEMSAIVLTTMGVLGLFVVGRNRFE